MSTAPLTPSQQIQIDNRDSTGKWKAKTHGEVDADGDPLGLEGSPEIKSGPLPVDSLSDGEPKVWLGSEGAYAAGDMVGDWYDARDAADVTVEDLYRHQGLEPGPDAGDEVAVMDHENLGVRDPISPQRAAELAETIDEVAGSHGEDGVTAYKALVDDRGGDEISGAEFTNLYAGDYDTESDYARNVITTTVDDHASREQLEQWSSYVNYGPLEADLMAEDPGPENHLPDLKESLDEAGITEFTVTQNPDGTIRLLSAEGDEPEGLSAIEGSGVSYEDLEEVGTVEHSDDGTETVTVNPGRDIEDYAPNFAQQAEDLAEERIEAGDGRWVRDNLDYQHLAADMRLGGSMNFVEKFDGTGIHAFRAG